MSALAPCAELTDSGLALFVVLNVEQLGLCVVGDAHWPGGASERTGTEGRSELLDDVTEDWQ